MRKLNTADVFLFCRLVKATEAREQLRGIVSAAAKQKEGGNAVDVTQVGVDGLLAIVEAAVEPRAEAMVYQFLSGPLECGPDDVKAMPLDELLPALKVLAAMNNLSGFFDSVSGILGKA